MIPSRRNFLRLAAAGTAAVGLGGTRLFAGNHGGVGAAAVQGSPQALRIPPLFAGGTITARMAQQNVWPDIATEVWTYGGSYPAPTIRVRSGERFTAQFSNMLPDHSNIHWHGLLNPHNMDGHPNDVFENGASYTYSFAVAQRAGTYWYHPHPHMMTGPQVYRGMAGFFIVEDDEENALGLPASEYDVPLLIQDRRSEAGRQFSYILDDAAQLDGYLGDEVLANGTPDAFLEVARGLYRFRLLNGSNARIYQVALSDNSAFHVIGTDGGLLDRPYEVTNSMLAPAERLDVLIDFSRFAIGDSVTLKTLRYQGGTGRQQGAEMAILRFDVKRDGGSGGAMPATLATIEKLNPDAAVRQRDFTLRTDDGSSPPMHMINDRMFDMDRIDETVHLGDLEVWSFTNATLYPHPMHLHGAQFQVMDRNGNTALEPRDMGWKDTIYLPAYSTARVAVKFGPYAGVYLVHCHNLEHEDHGMMLNYETTLNDSAVEDRDADASRMELR
ncbi:MAG: multicopper oxidase domain-containing protein [Bacteroidetes bacterium]|nr:multicopper oxidase domain-containing protein [Bacteroidota bacterium]